MKHPFLAAAGSFLLTISGALLHAQTNLALGKPIVASSSAGPFVAPNANDGTVTTYWEGAAGAYPNTLAVSLGANLPITAVVVSLDPAWGSRTQTIEVLGHPQGTSTFTSLVAPAPTRSIPPSATA